MGRPKKQTVDYFPHVCNHGKTIFILEQKYGNDGYAFWFKLLEMLGSSEGHYLQLENGEDWEFLQAKTRLDSTTCEEMLDLLATLNAIDKDLWGKQKIVWSDNFVKNIEDVYKNRRVETPKKPSFYKQKPHQKEVSTNEKPQTKLKETRVNNTSAAELAKRLKDWILKNNPKAKTPDNLDKWTSDIDKMMRIDERTEDEIREVIDFCQQHVFWWKNILSADKLRKQYDRLYNETISSRKEAQSKKQQLDKELIR